ncbi:MAG: AraC family transcriptional regulator [Sandaracinaceae bacterium]|nr:AraC family transcriptional regulator [Sandaracinaceae bacterium]
MSSSTVHAGLPLGVLEGVRAGGHDPDALLRHAELRWDELRDPDARVPEEKYLRMLEALERSAQLVDFEVMGKLFRLETIGAVGYAIAAAENLEHAMRTLTRFGRLVHDETMYAVELSEAELWFGRALDARYARMRHPTVSSVASLLFLSRSLTGRADLAPVRVRFQHERPPDAERYDAFFGARVEFAANATGMSLPRWAGALPLVRQDPSLHAYLSRHAEALLERLPPREEALADRVRELVTQTLRSGTLTQARVAKQLAMSERTLQRRLSEGGTSFAAIVDDTRRALAQRYLGERRLSIHEVALLLGYSEPSAFFRAFKRWTGRTPLEFRDRRA